MNGDGYYQAGIDNFSPSDDLDEAFLDRDLNGIFDQGIDSFVDYNQNGQYDYGNNIYNGVLCQDTTNTSCTKTGVTIRQSTVLAMSSRVIGDVHVIDGPITLPLNGTVTYGINLTDKFGNSLANGTSFSLITNFSEAGTTATLSQTSIGVLDGPGANTIYVTLTQKDGVYPASGTITLTVTTPESAPRLFSFPVN